MIVVSVVEGVVRMLSIPAIVSIQFQDFYLRVTLHVTCAGANRFIRSALFSVIERSESYQT